MTILADPPWNLTLTGTRKRTKGGHGGPSLDYPTMTLDEICAMRVAEVGPGPRLEMFARSNRLGWDAWGNECISQDLPLQAA